MWFAWALASSVAYIAEPLVNYRSHELSMMKDLVANRPEVVVNDERNVLWRIRAKAQEKKLWKVVNECEFALGTKYANAITFSRYGEVSSLYGMTVTECEQEIRRNVQRRRETRRLIGKMWARVGDKYWWHRDFVDARTPYLRAVLNHPPLLKAWLKLALATLGRPFCALLKDARTRARQGRVSFG
jgi:hypothetical protein